MSQMENPWPEDSFYGQAGIMSKPPVKIDHFKGSKTPNIEKWPFLNVFFQNLLPDSRDL